MDYRFYRQISSQKGQYPDLEQQLDRIVQTGFNGVEGPLPTANLPHFRSQIEARGLSFIATMTAVDPTTIELLMDRAAQAGAVQISVLSGRDSMTFDEGCAFFENTLKAEERVGIRLAHSTRRGRLLYAPWVTAAYLRLFPDLWLTADFSEWTTVCASLLTEYDQDVWNACTRVSHLHCRIGSEHGPQVPDPRAPEFEPQRRRFEAWWDAIQTAHFGRDEAVLSVNMELLPPPVMPSLPYTRLPLADPNEVVIWLTRELRQRWGVPEPEGLPEVPRPAVVAAPVVPAAPEPELVPPVRDLSAQPPSSQPPLPTPDFSAVPEPAPEPTWGGGADWEPSARWEPSTPVGIPKTPSEPEPAAWSPAPEPMGAGALPEATPPEAAAPVETPAQDWEFDFGDLSVVAAPEAPSEPEEAALAETPALATEAAEAPAEAAQPFEMAEAPAEPLEAAETPAEPLVETPAFEPAAIELPTAEPEVVPEPEAAPEPEVSPLPDFSLAQPAAEAPAFEAPPAAEPDFELPAEPALDLAAEPPAPELELPPVETAPSEAETAVPELELPPAELPPAEAVPEPSPEAPAEAGLAVEAPAEPEPAAEAPPAAWQLAAAEADAEVATEPAFDLATSEEPEPTPDFEPAPDRERAPELEPEPVPEAAPAAEAEPEPAAEPAPASPAAPGWEAWLPEETEAAPAAAAVESAPLDDLGFEGLGDVGGGDTLDYLEGSWDTPSLELPEIPAEPATVAPAAVAEPVLPEVSAAPPPPLAPAPAPVAAAPAAPEGPPKTIALEDFQRALQAIFNDAYARAQSHVDVKAGDLHDRVTEGDTRIRKMPECCRVMRRNMKRGDNVTEAPKSGEGPTLTIRYVLPR